MSGGELPKFRVFQVGFFQVSNSGNLKKTQDLTPASRGRTPTTPGQLQPTRASPSLSWPAPARFSQLQPVEPASARNKSLYPRSASVSPKQPQLIPATSQPAAGQPAPGATSQEYIKSFSPLETRGDFLEDDAGCFLRGQISKILTVAEGF